MQGATTHLEASSGKVNLLVVSLDEFRPTLGIAFLTTIKAVVIPHLDGLMIMEEAHPCFVMGVHKEKKGKETLFSAIQLEHELKRGNRLT